MGPSSHDHGPLPEAASLGILFEVSGGSVLDKFFDRLGDMMRTLVRQGSSTRSSPYSDFDPDMREAWKELNDYLSDEGPGNDSSADRPSDELAARDHLREDYANLEVPFATSYDLVRRSYKKLMGTYHPDRNAGDPERLRVATEITKKINVSFHRIRAFEEGNIK